MAYVDPNFNSTFILPLVGDCNDPLTLGTVSTASGGTATYSGNGTSSINGAFMFPKFASATKIVGIRVFVKTAPGTGVTNMVWAFLNGTSTAATITIGTHTAGEFVDAVMATPTIGSTGVTTSPAWLAADGQLTMRETDTNTATASTLGAYAVYAECRNLFTV